MITTHQIMNNFKKIQVYIKIRELRTILNHNAKLEVLVKENQFLIINFYTQLYIRIKFKIMSFINSSSNNYNNKKYLVIKANYCPYKSKSKKILKKLMNK